MKRMGFLIVVVLFLSVANAQSTEQRRKQFNISKDIALQGYDPVSYFKTKPVEGSKEFAHTYKGVIYFFSSNASREEFKSSPEKYEPLYGGWCAYAMGETGEKVKVDPETFKIVNGKLVLFYNFWGNNTLLDWNKNEVKLKESADRNWKKIIP